MWYFIGVLKLLGKKRESRRHNLSNPFCIYSWKESSKLCDFDLFSILQFGMLAVSNFLFYSFSSLWGRCKMAYSHNRIMKRWKHIVRGTWSAVCEKGGYTTWTVLSLKWPYRTTVQLRLWHLSICLSDGPMNPISMERGNRAKLLLKTYDKLCWAYLWSCYQWVLIIASV